MLTSTSPRICSGIRKNGERCQARATAANDFCSFHRPDMLEAFHSGRIQGGRRSKYPVNPFEEKIGARLALRLDSRGGIQASVDHVLRMLLFGGITPAYALAATRLIASASRNLDHTSQDSEDHSLDQYLPSISNHLRIQSGMKSEKQAPAGPTPQQLTAAASVPPMFEALNR